MSMRQKMAGLLAALLLGTAVFPGYATGSVSRSTVSGGNTEEPTSLSANGIEREQQVEGDVGQVDVTVGAALILQRSVTFTVSLTDAQTNGKVGEQTLTLGAEGSAQSRVRFEYLAPGSYILTVKGAGFADYTQKISVDNKAYTVTLLTGFLGGMAYESGNPHPGVVLIGDVNGSGTIDQADRTALVEAVDGGSNDASMDLNGDKLVDLTDLEYFAKGRKKAEDTQSTLELSVPAAVIGVSESAGTTVTGNGGQSGEDALKDFMKMESGIKLTPKNGGVISEGNPVELDFTLQGDQTSQIDGIVIRTDPENQVRKAVVSITYNEAGAEQTLEIPLSKSEHYLLHSSEVRTDMDDRGRIRIFLGSQIAVKKVTFTIVGTDNNNLAEISTVEFVNGMENRIPEPEMNKPEGLQAVPGNKSFVLTWNPCINVTGYEVMIRQGEAQETMLVSRNSLAVTSFQEDKLVNNTEYTVQVQSVNGTWRSGYGEPITVTPKADKKPDKPDNVKAVGKYRSIAVTWKDMEDTDSYNLYYKKSDEAEYHKIEGIIGNSYLMTELGDHVEYVIYVTGVNELGESGPSLSVKVSTTDVTPASMPKYGLINVAQEGGAGAHIANAWYFGGKMEDSPLDTGAGSAWGTVDHTPKSHYMLGSWDSGGYNELGAKIGLFYEFDQAYKLDTIALQEVVPQDVAYGYAQVRYWDENGNTGLLNRSQVSVRRKTDSNGRIYYLLKFAQPVMAKKLQIGLARYVASGTVTVSEVYFYYYDTLMEEIMALYEDDLHTVLKSDVTQGTIDGLRARVQRTDEISGETHPDMELLLRELDNAENILNCANLNEPVIVYNTISTSDVGRGFGGLNSWQPLGVTAAAGEELIVYVGHNTKKTGENTNLQLVATQYHAEAGAMFSQVTSLKVGMNQVKIPDIITTDVEKGGALYVQYTGSNANDHYGVRVSGGVEVPRLDLYRLTDEAERLARTKAYVEKLELYVSQMEDTHNQIHKGSENKLVNYDYEERNCILGASDIMLDKMMLSLPAKQILGGAGTGSAEEKAQRILASMDAMEDMMYLFYQHKGLNDNAENVVDQMPGCHLNIRYQRMFAGAFMYASGNHIGIEWPEAAGMMRGVPVTADADGQYKGGQYFGWGIAHEIGHCINQGTYAVAEITNNYFAQLAQAKDTNASVRFDYQKIYEKVTSGTKGTAGNVFTQLGMYWQLHLAYDKGYNFKTYEDVNEQLANLFFARVDTYSRTPSKAPNEVALTLGKDTDQNLMRLACAAAEKDILEFFEQWGKTPDEGTKAYAAQFEKETRAICYASDDARRYALQGSGSKLGTSGDVKAVSDSAAAAIDPNAANQVILTLGFQNIPEADVLGYEIIRCTTSGGKVVREPAGFATGNQFTDTIYSMNNRTVFYEVTLIDKYLNRSAVKTLDTIKIQHDGSQDKTHWTIRTEGVTAEEIEGQGTDDTPCAPAAESTVKRVIDQDVGTTCLATLDSQAAFTLEFNKSLTVTGFKYTLADGQSLQNGEYEIQIQEKDGWKTVAEGVFEDGSVNTVFFANVDNTSVGTYVTTAVRLVLSNQGGKKVEIAELDVLGVTGDNVDFRRNSAGDVLIGRLAEDYQYGSRDQDVVPKGSVIFTGMYKGNPAYNVVVLYDQNGQIVGGKDESGRLKAHQIILADVPEEGNLMNVSDGTWIYWIEPGQDGNIGDIQKVRAELYRVNNALTSEGQRLVSDSVFEKMPDPLEEIIFRTGDQ